MSYSVDLENIGGCATKHAALILQNKLIFSFLAFSYLLLGLNCFCAQYLSKILKRIWSELFLRAWRIIGSQYSLCWKGA